MATTQIAPAVEKQYFGRETAATFLDLSTRAIDEAIRDGELQAFKVGRRVLINRNALVEFAERVTASAQ